MVAFAARSRKFSLLQSVPTGPGDHQTMYSIGTGGLFSPVINWPKHEAYHSPPLSAAIKNAWSCASRFLCFVVLCLIKYREKFKIRYV